MSTQYLNDGATQHLLSIPSFKGACPSPQLVTEEYQQLDLFAELKSQQVAKHRALFTLSRYWPAIGGSELHTRHLIHAMHPHAEISVICHNSDDQKTNELATANSVSKTSVDDLVEVRQIGTEGLRRPVLGLLAKLHKNLRISRPIYDHMLKSVSYPAIFNASSGYDLIHNVYNGLTSLSETSLKAARERDIPFVFTPLTHTHAPEGTAWSSKRIMALYQQADALIAMTPYERNWLIDRGANPNTTHVCPVGPLVSNDVDKHSFRKSYNLTDEPIVLFLGRHVETKGYKELARAAEKIWDAHPTTRLFFVGPQTSTSRMLLAQLKDERLIVLDHVSQQEKCAALAACDLLCVPSTQESLGVIYLEAWHYGKPVIASDIEVMHGIIRNNIDGILVRPDPEHVAAAVNRLLNDPEMSKEMGRAGQESLRNNFSWDSIALEMSLIHKNVLCR